MSILVYFPVVSLMGFGVLPSVLPEKTFNKLFMYQSLDFKVFSSESAFKFNDIMSFLSFTFP